MLAIEYQDNLCAQSCEHQDVVAAAKKRSAPGPGSAASRAMRVWSNIAVREKLAWYCLDDNHVSSLLVQTIAHSKHR
ncbi:MAG TPA: hypothetical protein PKA28_09825 [Methylomusa anaerophila]|uniref:Uncharacterized protein n=1 Tax=Methylomusa anaerophila TaxID=1930071 RepID=A0A348AHV8_9FIRM|nr:hypothetical protein [Methylomusa anaerophila]BBB90656.1 hypothetical protein MAMMFC1_01317 [Methylomusa anaerophila]HML88737.1 hypothetical protein [Methylomusa anaerophila]